MELAIRDIGNSKGVVIPKAMLLQAGLQGAAFAEAVIEGGHLVLRKVIKPARSGWEAAAAQIAARGEDALVLGEFGNADDERHVW